MSLLLPPIPGVFPFFLPSSGCIRNDTITCYLPGPKADREFRISRSSRDATMDRIPFKG
jgi:hypothetical protein